MEHLLIDFSNGKKLCVSRLINWVSVESEKSRSQTLHVIPCLKEV